MRSVDFIVSVVIGELAGLLMLLIGRNLALPSGPAALLPWLPLAFPIVTAAIMAAGTLLGRWVSAAAYQLTKFLLVGGLNFLVDLGVLNFLIALSGIATGFYADAFKATSFLIAMAGSFLWNKFWTFGALSTSQVGRQFFEFFAVTLIGFFINVGTFAVLNSVIGAPSAVPAPTWASISAGGAAIAGLIWNFAGYKFLVFRKAQK